MTSRASTIVSAYAYRQGFQGQVRGVSDHAIEPTTNTLAGTRRAHMWQLRPVAGPTAGLPQGLPAETAWTSGPHGIFPSAFHGNSSPAGGVGNGYTGDRRGELIV